MTLYLVESIIDGTVQDKRGLESRLAEVGREAAGRGIQLIEVQVSQDYSRIFFILEGEQESVIQEALAAVKLAVTLIKPVRLVGQELERIKAAADDVNYLVEWNLPADLTMEQYLERKKRNSVHYAEVPEVEFSRTYVCEDMSKCLCFYKAPDEAAVKRAREAVKTPLDSITELRSADEPANG